MKKSILSLTALAVISTFVASPEIYAGQDMKEQHRHEKAEMKQKKREMKDRHKQAKKERKAQKKASRRN